MLWNWLRDRVKQSILAGVSDALAEIDSGSEDDAPAVARLELRFRKPEPEAAPDKARKTKTA